MYIFGGFQTLQNLCEMFELWQRKNPYQVQRNMRNTYVDEKGEMHTISLLLCDKTQKIEFLRAQS